MKNHGSVWMLASQLVGHDCERPLVQLPRLGEVPGVFQEDTKIVADARRQDRVTRQQQLAQM